MYRWFIMIIETVEGHIIALRGTIRPDGRLTRDGPRDLAGREFTPMFVRSVVRVVGGGWLWEVKRCLRLAGWPVPFDPRGNKAIARNE